MNMIRKTTALLLALLMIFSFSAAAFAEQFEFNWDDVDGDQDIDDSKPSGRPVVEYYDYKQKKTIKGEAAVEDIPGIIELASDYDHGYSCKIDLKGNTVTLSEEIEINYGEFTLTVKNGTFDGQSKCRIFYVVDADTTFNFENVKLINGNAGSDDGGAIYVDDEHFIFNDVDNYAFVNGCTISNCKADYGGAIYLSSDGWGSKVNKVKFENNTAETDGGAVYCNGKRETLSDCTFKNNSGRYGGSIYVDNDYVLVSGCTFEGGKASKSAHDIYVEEDDLTISHCTFKDCKESDAIDGEDYESVSNKFASSTSSRTGSLISGGTIWIAAGVAVAALAVCGVVFTKKKKNNTAA